MPYFDHLNMKIIKKAQHLKIPRGVHFRQLFCRFYFQAAQSLGPNSDPKTNFQPSNYIFLSS